MTHVSQSGLTLGGALYPPAMIKIESMDTVKVRSKAVKKPCLCCIATSEKIMNFSSSSWAEST